MGGMYRYEPGREASVLGEGAFGSVVSVYSDDGSPAALKIFEDDEDDETLDLATLRELSILRVLRESNGHPGIIPMIDVLPPNQATGGKIGMVMPYVNVTKTIVMSLAALV